MLVVLIPLTADTGLQGESFGLSDPLNTRIRPLQRAYGVDQVSRSRSEDCPVDNTHHPAHGFWVGDRQVARGRRELALCLGGS